MISKKTPAAYRNEHNTTDIIPSKYILALQRCVGFWQAETPQFVILAVLKFAFKHILLNYKRDACTGSYLLKPQYQNSTGELDQI